ncbi:MAG: cytochrome c oxidase subunit II [Candidatus Dadabacteria bacterium]|nr:cytochrome c oxidase subunit II [Candidatus Dadabacteria bacterium]NIQ14163.1 cytochrome c oxidase subunit II [Candidatus Dadabacteria bacterium]
MFSWIPESASNLASNVDNITLFVTIISVFFLVLITAILVYFSVKYRRKSEDQETAYITGNETIEIIWTIIPTILLMVIFVWAYIGFRELRNPPPEALEINVVAKQWLWQFDYFDGKKAINELTVKQNQPVRLIMRSDDVLHSFFVPQFRVKQDILPGNYTQLWFTPTKVGTYDLFCTEYCGAGHSNMLAKVHVLSPEAYTRWEKGEELGVPGGLAATTSIPPSELGEKLYTQRGCNACHSINGADGVGPTFKGLFGMTENLQDGSTVEVDENYLRESIYEPQAKMVTGYAPVMPAFKGILKDDEVTALIEYIKTVK